MARTVLTVFLSSTGADLDAYRAEIRKQIGAVDFLKCIAMEDFGPRDANAIDHCQKEVGTADLFVGVIGLRRGWEPDGDNQKRSITEMEYGWASGAGRSRFMCISPDDFSIKGNLRDNDEQHERQQAFRNRVSAERVAGVRNFESPAALAAEVITALLSHIISSDLIQHLRPDLAGPEAAQAQAPLAAAVETLAADDDIDLLALARNPRGVEVAELESKLRARADEHEQLGDAERQKSAEYWRHIGALSSLRDTQKAVEAYRKATHLNPEDIESWDDFGRLLSRTGDLAQAVTAFERMLGIASRTGNKAANAAATCNLGNVYMTTGDLKRAEEMHRKSLAYSKALGRKDGIATSYSNLGAVYGMRGDLKKAEEMFLKALALNDGLGRDEGIAICHGNLGNIAQIRGDLDRADEMYQKVLEIDLALGRPESVANTYGNLGNLALARGELEQAEDMYLSALTINEDLDRKEGLAGNHFNLGILELRRGNRKAACAHYMKSRDLYQILGSPEAAKVKLLMDQARCAKEKRKSRR